MRKIRRMKRLVATVLAFALVTGTAITALASNPADAKQDTYAGVRLVRLPDQGPIPGDPGGLVPDPDPDPGVPDPDPIPDPIPWHGELRGFDDLWFGSHLITVDLFLEQSRDRNLGTTASPDNRGRYVGIRVIYGQNFKITAQLDNFEVPGENPADGSTTVNLGSVITLTRNLLDNAGVTVTSSPSPLLYAGPPTPAATGPVAINIAQSQAFNAGNHGSLNFWSANYSGELMIPVGAQRAGEATAVITWTSIFTGVDPLPGA